MRKNTSRDQEFVLFYYKRSATFKVIPFPSVICKKSCLPDHVAMIFLQQFAVWYAAIARTVGHLSKSAEVMKLVNNLMKSSEVAVTMQEFSKEMTKVRSHFLGYMDILSS